MSENNKLHFHCKKPCGTRFETEAEEEVDGDLFARCPTCHQMAKQAAWQVNLMQTAGLQTGPKTEEGKKNSAANLQGYPTKEQQLVTRFNAMQSGVFAKTASVYPAKPGKYPDCEVCEHFNEEFPNDSDCKPHKACLKKTEIFLANHIAQETQNPDVLRPFMANLHAGVMSILNSMMLSIAQKGVDFEIPQMWYDKDSGSFIPQTFTNQAGETQSIVEIKANPLVKVFMDMLHKNGMTLSDLAMTPKVQEEHQIMGGYTKGDVAPQDINEIRQKQLDQLEAFKKLSQDAAEELDNDPTWAAIRDETQGDD